MARNTRLILQSLRIEKVMVAGHSMGGMLAALRDAVSRPGGAPRALQPDWAHRSALRPWDSTDESYKRALGATFQSIRASLMRYVAHNPAAWKSQPGRVSIRVTRGLIRPSLLCCGSPAAQFFEPDRGVRGVRHF